MIPVIKILVKCAPGLVMPIRNSMKIPMVFDTAQKVFNDSKPVMANAIHPFIRKRLLKGDLVEVTAAPKKKKEKKE